MTNPQAVRALTSLWVFTIVEGFYHTSEFGLTTLSFGLYWLQVVVASVVGWLVTRQSPVRGAVLACVVSITGFTWGSAFGAQSLHVLSGISGKQVEAVATVQAVYPNRRSDTIILVVSDIRENGRSKSCQVIAAYYRSHHAHPLAQGTQVELSGTFLERQVASSATQGRHGTPSSSATYEFQGRVLTQNVPLPDRWSVWRSAIVAPLHAVPGLASGDVQLAESLMFGGSAVPQADKQAFLAAGLVHVLAASGANVIILESVLQWVLFPAWRRLRLPYSVWLAALLASIWVYVGLCLWQPSIQRAAILATYRLLATGVGRQARTGDGLLWTLAVMAAVEPGTVSGVSAALSFLATGAVERAVHAGGAPASRPKHWVRGWLQKLRRVVRASVLVELFILPVSVAVFGQWTPYAVLSNVLAEPLLGCLLPLCLILTGVAWVGRVIAWLGICTRLLGRVTHLGLALFLGLAKMVAAWPGALLSVPAVPNGIWIGYYGVILYVFYLRNRNRAGGKRKSQQADRVSKKSL